MKKIVLLALVVMSLAATLIAIPAPASPCAGGTYGGSRNVGKCVAASTTKCNPTGAWDWVYDASCDVWCCPGVSTYVLNSCGTFNPASPKACCDAAVSTGYWFRSPVPPTCTP